MSAPVPGRRVAARTRRELDPTVVAAAVAVVVAALLLLLTGRADRLVLSAPLAGAVPVNDVLVVCPQVGGSDEARHTVRAQSIPLEGREGAGTLRYARGAAIADAEERELARGRVFERSPKDSVTLQAGGTAAAGFAAFQLSEGAFPTTLAAAPCPTPRSEWWFTGAGASLDHESDLVLANVDSDATIVDVTILGPDGPIDAPGGRGITLGPGETRTVPLIDLAPQVEEMALRVTASRGQVVAAVADRQAERAGADRGSEWLPAQERPARVLDLAAGPAAPQTRSLLLANPSDLEARVEVSVAGESGTFAPTEQDAIRVPPGAVVAADVTSTVPDATGVTVRSNVPVTAALRSTLRGDTTITGPASTLTGPAGAPLTGGAGRLDAEVVLTAGDDRGVVEVVTYDDRGREQDRESVELAAGSTGSWQVPGGSAYLVVLPRAGEVRGSVLLSGPAGISQVTLQDLPVELRRPVVVPALR